MAIVELLAQHGEPSLTLADIVRRTGQSRATAHAVISELAAHQWVTRLPDGTYGLGASLVRLAQSISQADHLAHQAGPVLTALADELGFDCFLARRAGDEVTVTAHSTPAGAVTARRGWPTPGATTPLKPPVCREFIAWEQPAAQAAWIAAAPPALRTRLELALQAVRARGAAIERLTDAHATLLSALDSLDPATLPAGVRTQVGELLGQLSTIDFLADELPSEGRVAVMTIGAPVLGEDGRVAASVVSCPDRELSADELARTISATRAAAERLNHPR